MKKLNIVLVVLILVCELLATIGYVENSKKGNDFESININIGNQFKLTDVKAVKYKSLDTSVAIVDENGNIKAVNSGKTEILLLDLNDKVIKRILIVVSNNSTWTISNEIGNSICTEALEKIYSDNNYDYYVPNGCYASKVYLVYENGTKYSIEEAINNKKVTIEELISKGANITKESK